MREFSNLPLLRYVSLSFGEERLIFATFLDACGEQGEDEGRKRRVVVSSLWSIEEEGSVLFKYPVSRIH